MATHLNPASATPAPQRKRLCLVTGGAGFIGCHLVRLLLDRGDSVRVLDVRDSPALDRRAELVQGSILDARVVAGAMAGVDQLFHLAANPNLWAVNERAFMKTNWHGTQVVLAAAAAAGVQRIVHTSTESILVAGHGRGNFALVNENVRRTFHDMPGEYCQSKFLAERTAMTAAARGLPVVVVNPTLPVGPGDHLITPPTRMIMDFVNGKNPAYMEFEMNLIDVQDAALGHILAAEHGRVGERYILGGENVRMSRLLDMLAELTGLSMPHTRVPYLLALGVAGVSECMADWIRHKPPRASLAGVRIAGSSMAFDCTKARQELGLEPRSVRPALSAGVAWLCRQGLIRRPLPEPALRLLESCGTG